MRSLGQQKVALGDRACNDWQFNRVLQRWGPGAKFLRAHDELIESQRFNSLEIFVHKSWLKDLKFNSFKISVHYELSENYEV